MPPTPGVLYVVATPIGNLEDLTFRALRILKEVDVIAAEDTRRTSNLLTHYGIQKSLVSLREHNEARESRGLIDRIVAGESVAVVSDAGTPAVADPGARLVRAVRAAGMRVVPIPGASAVTAAISVSGLTSDQFVFAGFPPASGSERRRFFEAISTESRAVVLFEAPHRIARTLDELSSVLAFRPIHIHREITKINEEYVKRPKDRLNGVHSKGEFTLVVEPRTSPATESDEKSQDVPNLVERLANSHQFTREEMAMIVSAVLGTSFSTSRNMIKKYEFSVKQRNRQTT